MKLTDKQIQRLVRLTLGELQSQNVITYRAKESDVAERACAIVRADFHRESQLDMEVNKMMDDLERQNQGEFQRYKMFPMLKKRLAKEKGIIL